MPCSSGHTGEFRVLGERELADLQRAQAYLEARCCGYCNRVLTTTYCGCFWEEMSFKQCRQCGSYQHTDSDHGEQP